MKKAEKGMQNYIPALADYARQKLIAAFGEGSLLQPCRDGELKSGIDAPAFFDGCLPNRGPVTNKPDPGDILFRFDTLAWCNRADFDRFVDDCRNMVKRMLGQEAPYRERSGIRPMALPRLQP